MRGTIRPAAIKTQVWRTLIALLALGALLLSAGPAGAATTFAVNRTGDAADRDITNARCDTSANKGNQCTLRAAIEEGNDAVLKVQLKGSDAGEFATGLRIEAADSTIKGLVINRFGRGGISIVGLGAAGNSVEGNFIGTNASGTADRGNGGIGVAVSAAAPDNTVGGTEPAARNVISGNDLEGVLVAGADNRVQGNFIGTAADGSGDLGNDTEGVQISIRDNTIGGTESGAANTIARNGGSGVLIDTSTAVGNSLLSNEIFANGGLGIDLNNDGVTLNDTDDPDTGENNLQNFPVIDSATWNSTTDLTTINGTLNSNPGQTFRIQCFLTGNQPDASGHGEGAVLLDTTSRSTNSEGNATFECDTQEDVGGREVTATATNDSTGDTSEFSENKEVFGTVSLP